MSHQIETMAYAGQTPWHGLGNHLEQRQSIDVWAAKAGMNWSIESAPVCYIASGQTSLGTAYGDVKEYPDQRVLYRSDTQAPLSVVGSRYKVVQPSEVLEFYRDLSEVAGYELETAGVLKGGRKFWALARTGKETVLKGNDCVKGYLLLATSCDGTLATTATPTTVRVVCANTLAIALSSTNSASGAIKVPHSRQFDAQAVKQQLGVAVTSWDSFMYRMKTLSERKVKSHEAMNYFLNVICQGSVGNDATLVNERALKKVQALYDGHGRGAELAAAKDTAWGLLCAVTEFVDHERRARSTDHRLDSAWFGQGANLKQRALDQAIGLVILASLPLCLRLRGKSSSNQYRSTLFYVDVTTRPGEGLADAVARGRELDGQRKQAGLHQAALDDAARAALALGAFEEDPDDGWDAVQEFYPESDDSQEETRTSPPLKVGVAAKLAQQRQRLPRPMTPNTSNPTDAEAEP